MLARPFTPAERMTDVFDRAATLNFTTVATVRGRLEEAALLSALRCLERRHPLLTARIARSGTDCSFAPGEAARIPLRTREGDQQVVRETMDASLCHREWLDEGPRAELTWVRHASDHGTLLLCLHHVVSDGTSGILALRDLLAALSDPTPGRCEPLPAPGQDAFFPASFAELKQRTLAALAQGTGAPPKGPRPFRLRCDEQVPMAQRRARSTLVRFTREEAAALEAVAHQAGATLHGALCAALSLAIASEPGATPLQRLAHPVSLRRYLRAYFPETTPIGEAVGYYVSSVQTDHEVTAERSLPELAREITEAIRRKKGEHEPLISAPIRGPLFTERASALGLDGLRDVAEQRVFVGTYGISNLGRLEQLGVRTQVGELTVEDFYFGMAGSVMGAMGAAVVSFDGGITLQLTHVEPLITREVVERVSANARARLLASLATGAG